MVGGGPSAAASLPELQAWDGDVWGINYTAEWLTANGVDATMVTADGAKFRRPFQGVSRAILPSCAHPDTFLDFRDVLVYDICEHKEGGVIGGCTTATRAPHLALLLGYADVSFFGCEGSWEGMDHVDRHEGETEVLIVRAGGRDYKTCPEYLLQCENLAIFFSRFPDFYEDRSGGLLTAVRANPDTWEVVAVSDAMKEHLESRNGENSMYETRYTEAA